MNGGKALLGVGLAAMGLIFALIFSPFFMVGAGQVAVSYNRGTGETKTYMQGTHFRMPIVQSVHEFDVKTQRIDIQAESASKDLQVVHVTAMLNYHLVYDKVNELFTKVGVDYDEKVIYPITNEVIKAEVANFPVEQIITSREKLKEKIQVELKEKLLAYHIELEGVNLVNIKFDDEFNKVVEEKQIEEQKIKTAEYQRRQAEEYKKKTILEAEAEAEKQRLMRNTLTQDMVELKWIEKWNGILPTYMLGDKGVLMVQPQ